MNERTNFNRRTRPAPPATPYGTGSARLRRLHLSFRRYVLVSTGIATTALGLALVVSFLAVAYADSPQRHRFDEVSEAVISAEVSSSYLETTFARHEMPPPAPLVIASQRIQALSRDTMVTRGRISNVNITFYDCADQGFCGAMYNGRKVYEGAAACSWNLAIGTKFVISGDPTNRVYICEDRGLLANTWVDIFWYHPADGYRWQSLVGRHGIIEILE
ncbi:MAG: hypothetical protein GEU75_16255 [Dehalococcoidia bacterium]|nr:hypothetical protein [Dehalococcoidia bacterium]